MKEKMDNVWCTFVKAEGHYKNQCPALIKYVATRAPNPVGLGDATWCEICRSRGHRPEKLPFVAKILEHT